MCGRVRLSSDYSEIKIRLKFAPNSVAPNFEPDWNKPPTAPMLVAIRSIDGERVPKMMKWGLIPHWAKDDKLQYSTFNGASRGIYDQTCISGCVDARGQRCLVVTDGFYEWKKLDAKGKQKQPFARRLPIILKRRTFRCTGKYSWNFHLGLKMKSAGPAPREGWHVGPQTALST
jgi:putative SOS response-associated peptidase YedK